MQYGGGRSFKSKEKASEIAIIESFSMLGQSYFFLNHGKYQMSAEAHGTIEYVQKKRADAQHLVAMSHAWEAFAKSKEGKAFLKKEGASFEKLLSDTGASVAGHYAAAKFDADAFAAGGMLMRGVLCPALRRLSLCWSSMRRSRRRRIDLLWRLSCWMRCVRARLRLRWSTSWPRRR